MCPSLSRRRRRLPPLRYSKKILRCSPACCNSIDKSARFGSREGEGGGGGEGRGGGRYQQKIYLDVVSGVGGRRREGKGGINKTIYFNEVSGVGRGGGHRGDINKQNVLARSIMSDWRRGREGINK